MTFTANAKCVLVVGATSGIGKDLALAVHELPSRPTVIVAGRRKDRLDDILVHGSKVGNENLHALVLDVTSDKNTLENFVKDTLAKFPNLDALILSAGVQHVVNFRDLNNLSRNLELMKDEFATNYISILTLVTLFLPHFTKLDAAGKPSYIIPVSSGLASQPAPSVPGYCATKAALRSLIVSLRSQFRGTKIHFIEISPPLVESELHDHQGRTPALAKFWMPLDEFTPQVIQGLERGEETIAIGAAAQFYAKYETGKQEQADAMAKRGM